MQALKTQEVNEQVKTIDKQIQWFIDRRIKPKKVEALRVKKKRLLNQKN